MFSFNVWFIYLFIAWGKENASQAHTIKAIHAFYDEVASYNWLKTHSYLPHGSALISLSLSLSLSIIINEPIYS